MLDERVDVAASDEALDEWSLQMDALFSAAPSQWQRHWLREKAKALRTTPQRDIPRSTEYLEPPTEFETGGSGANSTQFALLLIMIFTWMLAIYQFGRWQGWW